MIFSMVYCFFLVRVRGFVVLGLMFLGYFDYWIKDFVGICSFFVVFVFCVFMEGGLEIRFV